MGVVLQVSCGEEEVPAGAEGAETEGAESLCGQEHCQPHHGAQILQD